MIKIRPHHKFSALLVLLAVLCFVTSFLIPTLSSYFIVAGIALLLLGLFLIDPSVLPF